MISRGEYWHILFRAAFAVLALALLLPSTAKAGTDSLPQRSVSTHAPPSTMLVVDERDLDRPTSSVEHRRYKHSLFVKLKNPVKDPTQAFVLLTESQVVEATFVEQLSGDIRPIPSFPPEPSPRPPRLFV